MSRIAAGRVVTGCLCAGVGVVALWSARAVRLERDAGIPRPMPQGRTLVKRALDPGTPRIAGPVDTTVSHLLGMPRPAALPRDGSVGEHGHRRFAPLETTVWRVRARVVNVVEREDGDVYLTLEGADGARTVAELPDPALCRSSPYLPQIARTRAALVQRLAPSRQPRPLNLQATVTGVGFFGRASRDNGARLHPLLAVEFSP